MEYFFVIKLFSYSLINHPVGIRVHGICLGINHIKKDTLFGAVMAQLVTVSVIISYPVDKQLRPSQ